MPKTTAVAALPGAPVARPVRGLSAWWTQRIGHRDAAGPAPDPATGHLPHTLRLHSRAAAAESAVSAVLHQQVTHLDQAFITVCGQIAHHHRAATTAAETASAVPASAEPGSLLAAARARELRRLRSESTSHQQAVTELTGRVAGLLAQRRHLLNQARDLVDGHAARYGQLVACHRRGYVRSRGRSAAATAGAPLPGYTPTAGWVHGDLPVLTAAVDPGTREVVEWALREFDRPEQLPRLRAV